MERRPRYEQGPRTNFLREDLKVTFEIAVEAVRHLPAVSHEDRRTGRERYGALLGIVSFGPNPHIQIKGVYQEVNDHYGTYKEGIEHVTIDLRSLRSRIKGIQEKNFEFRQFNFLGDVHTHPSGILRPSEADIISVAQAYESGDVRTHEPYIFGVAALRRDGQMEYNFYRLIKTEGGYGYVLLDWK